MDHQPNWLEVLTTAKAIWQFRVGGPHAAYDMADRHADFYFNTDVAVSDPKLLSDIALKLINSCERIGTFESNFWVLSYSGSISASLILASRVSHLLNSRLAYMDVRTEVLNFPIKKGDRALVVTDDIHSGGSIKKLINICSSRGASVISPIITIANFSGSNQIEGRQIISIYEKEIESWPSSECPLCAQGSEAIPARKGWQKLMAG
jgi:hypothetical protein